MILHCVTKQEKAKKKLIAFDDESEFYPSFAKLQTFCTYKWKDDYDIERIVTHYDRIFLYR